MRNKSKVIRIQQQEEQVSKVRKPHLYQSRKCQEQQKEKKEN